MDHPTTLRLNTSSTMAKYNNPVQVGTQVMSEDCCVPRSLTHEADGRAALADVARCQWSDAAHGQSRLFKVHLVNQVHIEFLVHLVVYTEPAHKEGG